MRKSTLIALVLFIGTVAASAGCGGGDSPSASTCAAACGGDVVGIWTMTDVCFDVATLSLGLKALCPQAVVTTTGGELTGSVGFGADSTIQIEYDETLSYAVEIPASASCLGATTCAELDALLKQEDDSFTCTGSATCTCTFNEGGLSVPVTGTYTIAGTSITATYDTGGTSTWPYCVQGESLVLHNSPSGWVAHRTTR